MRQERLCLWMIEYQTSSLEDTLTILKNQWKNIYRGSSEYFYTRR